MKRFRNILFLADQADSLSRVFRRALSLAQANGAQLTVIDTVELSTNHETLPASAADQDFSKHPPPNTEFSLPQTTPYSP